MKKILFVFFLFAHFLSYGQYTGATPYASEFGPNQSVYKSGANWKVFNVDENDIETDAEVLVKRTANKSKVKIFIIQQIDRMIDLEEIAEAKGMKVSELISEIEHICYSGTKLNLDYYIDKIMDYDRQEEIYDYFMNAETDSIQDALDEFEEDEYGEDELRLMRIKFLSEYAM